MKNKILIFLFIGIFVIAGSIFAENITRESVRIKRIVKVLRMANIDENKIEVIRNALVIILNKDNKEPIVYFDKKDPEIYDYLSRKAEERGYKKRPNVEKNKLSNLLGLRIHQDVKGDLISLMLDAAFHKIKINFISGYRSLDKQEYIFFKKLGKEYTKKEILSGIVDEKIDKVLSTVSFPGYSKHHTGKTVDFSCGHDRNLTQYFSKTNCFGWLSKDNFSNAKKYNFYPSYPKGIKKQGPDPEPWEFIWKK